GPGARQPLGLRGAARHRGVPRAAPQVPRLRPPRDRRVPGLVPALRRHVELGRRLHGREGGRQHQRRPDLRPAAVRHHVRPGLALRPARQQDVRPDRRGARGPLQQRDGPPRFPPRPPGGPAM
ncbi:MAG: Putative membrane protein (Fragment), partial [uncultured Solirubrobacteraceae bacterium]